MFHVNNKTINIIKSNHIDTVLFLWSKILVIINKAIADIFVGEMIWAVDPRPKETYFFVKMTRPIFVCQRFDFQQEIDE